MSIASLARSRAIRTAPLPRDGAESTPGRPPRGGDDASRKTISDALTAVAAYIPSEVIAIYTLVLAMTVSDGSGTPTDGQPVPPAILPLWVYCAFLAAIPFMVWLVFAVNKVEAKEAIPWRPQQWPYWEAISSMVAFTAWSAVLPKSAFLRWDGFTAPIASIALVVVSIFLPLIGVLVTTRR